jgi:hypothetical protein
VGKELMIPSEEEQFEDAHLTQFGLSIKPFGGLRTAVVEFLSDLFKLHCKELHHAFAEADLYNTLLFFFEYHPFNNFLH